MPYSLSVDCWKRQGWFINAVRMSIGVNADENRIGAMNEILNWI